MAELDWSTLYAARRDIAKRFGDIWSLPLARRYYNVLSELGGEGTRLLEIGAGDRALREKMRGYWADYVYSSCDIDSQGAHDFSHIDEVTGQYDVICGFEIIEHVTLGDAQKLLACCAALSPQGGRIALTTPNIFYPPGFLRDATHITPFCYDELGGLLEVVGYRVTAIYRLHHDSLIKKVMKRWLFYPLFRLLGIDFAHQIMIVAERP